MAKTDLPEIGRALNQISWQWLNDYHPLLAEAIEMEVDRGAEPLQIRRFVMAKTDRLELALRCEQAARCLAMEHGQSS